MKSRVKWEYDFEDDIFVFRPMKRKYDSSVQIGNIIFDLDKKGKINGIEILNASKLLSVSKISLKNLIYGKIKIVAEKEVVRIDFVIKSYMRNAKRTTTLSVERIRPEFVKPTELEMAVA